MSYMTREVITELLLDWRSWRNMEKSLAMQQTVISNLEMSEDNRETIFLSQRLSTHLQRGNGVSFPDTVTFPQD